MHTPAVSKQPAYMVTVSIDALRNGTDGTYRAQMMGKRHVQPRDLVEGYDADVLVDERASAVTAALVLTVQ